MKGPATMAKGRHAATSQNTGTVMAQGPIPISRGRDRAMRSRRHAASARSRHAAAIREDHHTVPTTSTGAVMAQGHMTTGRMTGTLTATPQVHMSVPEKGITSHMDTAIPSRVATDSSASPMARGPMDRGPMAGGRTACSATTTRPSTR